MTEMVEVVKVGWDNIPIHPIVCFFGFFTLTSIAAGLRGGEFEKFISNTIILSNIVLSMMFYIIITVHNVLEVSQMTFDGEKINYNTTFLLFSFAWGIAFGPICFFWALVRRIE